MLNQNKKKKLPRYNVIRVVYFIGARFNLKNNLNVLNFILCDVMYTSHYIKLDLSDLRGFVLCVRLEVKCEM